MRPTMPQICSSILLVIGSGVQCMRLGVWSILRSCFFLPSLQICWLYLLRWDCSMMLRKGLNNCQNCNAYVVVLHWFSRKWLDRKEKVIWVVGVRERSYISFHRWVVDLIASQLDVKIIWNLSRRGTVYLGNLWNGHRWVQTICSHRYFLQVLIHFIQEK